MEVTIKLYNQTVIDRVNILSGLRDESASTILSDLVNESDMISDWLIESIEDIEEEREDC